jgi:hypothetical protein
MIQYIEKRSEVVRALLRKVFDYIFTYSNKELALFPQAPTV